MELRDNRNLGIAFLAFVFFFGLTYLVLGTAIGWPASLSADMTTVLPLIKQNFPLVVVGYYLFVITSLCLLPMAFMARHVFKGQGKPKWDLTIAIAAIAVILRIIPIYRWLSIMPEIGAGHISSSTETNEAIFNSFNAFLDGFGTQWGDQLFTGIWIGFVSFLTLHKHKVLASFGLLTALIQLVATFLNYSIDMNKWLSVTQSFIYLWALFVGLRFLLGSKKQVS